MSQLHAPAVPAQPTPAPSRSQEDGSIILPRRIGWGVAVSVAASVAVSAVALVFAAGGWTKDLDRRVADLERARDAAVADRKSTSERLERIERTVCLLCTGQLGPGSCPASCRL